MNGCWLCQRSNEADSLIAYSTIAILSCCPQSRSPMLAFAAEYPPQIDGFAVCIYGDLYVELIIAQQLVAL